MKLWVAYAALFCGLPVFNAASRVPPPSHIVFTDITERAGIHFVHHNGAFGKKYLPETMGSGCAFVDLDGDGWPDILLLNSRDWTPQGRKHMSALYRNNRNGTFTDITAGSGLDVEMYAMGVAVADYDNDGRPDIYITALDGDHLFHNEGRGKFRDVTAASGIRNANFGTSAAWLDYDRDGLADLFVANYVQWSPQTDVWCSLDGIHKGYCTPESSKGAPSKLYHNLGNGRFEDVSVKAGIADKISKSLGVVVLDYDDDGWPDIFVSNDTEPNKLFRNNHDGTFSEQGVAAGVAYAEDGAARGAMGADAIDYDRSGRPSLLVGNYSHQMLALYHNEGQGLFADRAPASPVGLDSLLSLTFGAFFFDYDLDGFPDIFAANGHSEENISNLEPKVKYREPPLMFRNLGHGSFQDVSELLGQDFSTPLLARGAAYADFDGDGDLDILITTNNGSARLYRNDGGNRNRWIRVNLSGVKSNRSALGAVVRIQSASGTQWQTVHSGSSYCSQSELALTFGLGTDDRVSRLTVEWPSGQKQSFPNLAVNRSYRIDEAAGISPD
ncbi:MAG: CRTAC1 family protein [Bryobacteraceae bacterium]